MLLTHARGGLVGIRSPTTTALRWRFHEHARHPYDVSLVTQETLVNLAVHGTTVMVTRTCTAHQTTRAPNWSAFSHAHSLRVHVDNL